MYQYVAPSGVLVTSVVEPFPEQHIVPFLFVSYSMWVKKIVKAYA